MRLLKDNIIDLNSTISATNENSNYPIENVIDGILTKPFISTSVSSVITITWDTEQSANSLFYGYAYIGSISVVLKDVAGSTVYSGSTTTTYETGSIYFGASYTDIRSAEITITGETNNLIFADGSNAVTANGDNLVVYGDNDLTLGGLSMGVYETAPGISPTVNTSYQYNTNVYKSTGGQQSGTKITHLKNVDVNYPFHTNAEKITLDNFFNDVMTVDKFYIDIWPESHEVMTPLYCNLTSHGQIRKAAVQGSLFSTTAKFQECR